MTVADARAHGATVRDGVCNELFPPGAEELRWAAAVMEAFALPENAGKGAVRVEGKMAELLHLEQAQRLVALAERIAGTE